MKLPFCTIAVWLAITCATGGCASFNRPLSEAAEPADVGSANSAQAPPASTRAPVPQSSNVGPAPKWVEPSQATERSTASAPTAPGAATKGAAATTAPTTTGGKTNAAGAASDPQALADVLAELAAMGALAPEAQQRLIEDLRTTDPSLWPGVVDTFRASLAYRRRAAERANAALPAADPLAELAASAEPANTAESSARAPANRAGPVAVVSHEAHVPESAATSGAPTPPPLEPTASAASPDHEANPKVSASAPPASWQQQLGPAMNDLEKQTRAAPTDAEAVARHVWLRMLYLAAGRRDEALKPIPGIAPAQQDYWSKQIFALATYLDTERNDDPSRRAAETVQHLARAAASLAEQAPLVVRNLAFCTAVESYGVHKRIEQHEFKPDQELLIYAEVENFKSEETEQGFHTALQPSYQILDGQGRRVAHDELPLTEEVCLNRRRDYFVRYFIKLPKTLYDGAYTLEWTIEDTLARKIGQATIEFTVKQKK